MKTFSKILSVFLIFSAILVLLVSCGDNAENDKNPSSADEDVPYGTDIRDYKVVRSEDASEKVIKFTAIFKKEIQRYTGAELGVSDDYLESGESADGKKEILIGNTSRDESVKVAKGLENAPESAYAIVATDDKIVISAKGDEALIRAMKYFLMTYACDADTENYVSIVSGDKDTGKVDLDSIVFDNFTELRTAEKSNIYEPISTFYKETLQYPTIVRLYHNGPNNGMLLSTFQSAENFFGIHRSTDDGKTWSEICEIKEDKFNKGYDLDWSPFLFELPVDMGDFKEGTLILAANSKNDKSDNFTATTITLYASTDLGESWESFCNIDTAGGLKEGLWEPFLIFEEERGRLYCFYSDDSDPEHDQKIVYKYSTDLVNWVGKDGKTGADADPKEAIACTNQKLRPGMASIAKMNNGEYYMTFELDNMPYGNVNAPIYCKRTTDLDDWGDVSSYGSRVETVDGKAMGTSPWCAWTSAGGECGTLIVVARWMHNGVSLTGGGTDMLVSFDYGKTFVAIKNPIPYTNKDGSRSGYSPALIFSEDGSTLYYVNNPINPTGLSYNMVLAKIKIW